MKKIKILRIIARLNIGGPAIHAVLLTEGLNKARFDSLLICGSLSQDEGDMLYYAIEKNVKPYFIPELKRELNLLNDIVAFKKIYNLIKFEKPDIIHTHTAKAGALGRLAAIVYNISHPFKKKHTKLIHTFHGNVFSGYFNKFKTILFIFIERLLAFFTCKIVSISESERKDLISLRISREDKIRVIPLGLELEKFLNLPPRNNSNNFLNIGIVGRLVPIKNHQLFLEAAARIIEHNPQMGLRFKIIGDGELRSELEEYSTKLNILNHVDFLGWQKDLVSVYSGLDVVALTSINEGTPVSLIEAMACGKAVVATDVGGVRDLLGREIDIGIKLNADFKVLERGVAVNSDDYNSFAAALTFVLQNNELRKNMAMIARNFVSDRFTKDRLIKDIELLYNSILGHRSLNKI